MYKEECGRCFGSSTDPTGIDICLTCYTSGCNPKGGEPDENHSLNHFKQTDHPIVANIQRVPASDPNKDSKTEIRLFCHQC